MKTKKTALKKVRITNSLFISQKDFFLIAGPCVIENEKMAVKIAAELKKVCEYSGVPFIFKASYDKANRSSGSSFRGQGMDKGLKILNKIKNELKIPVLTDVHDASQAVKAGKIADVLQIPAFLCRQTDLLTACARTGRAVNVKKGQFLSPFEIHNIIKKIELAGNKNILLTERGFSFGYNNLVVDLRSIAYMKKTGYPVIIDATHSVQRPGGEGDRSGGDREYIETIAKGAVAAGANGVFMEAHHDVKNALSDRDTQYPLDKVSGILALLKEIFEAAN